MNRFLSLLCLVLAFSSVRVALGQSLNDFDNSNTYRVLFGGDVSHFKAMYLIDQLIKEETILFKVKEAHFESVEAFFRQGEIPTEDQINKLLAYDDHVIGIDLTSQPWGASVPFSDSLRKVIALDPDRANTRYGVTIRFWSHVSSEKAKTIVDEVFGLQMDMVRKDANWMDLEIPLTNYERVEQQLLASDIVVDVSQVE